MPRCLVSFGANIGDARQTIVEASDELSARLRPTSTDYRLSRLYKTPPVGGPSGQPPFVNAAAAFTTDLSVWDVWAIVREIETQFGRSRNRRWEARKLDLDVLLYDLERVWTPHLKVPHPRMCMRRFILIPAKDVAGDWLDPVSQQTVRELCDSLQSKPASLCVISPNASIARRILIQVGLEARAEFLASNRTSDRPKASRWVSLVSDGLDDAFSKAAEQSARLVVALAVPGVGQLQSKTNSQEMPASELNRRIATMEGAWEDRFSRLAGALRLCSPQGRIAPQLTQKVARYLLDSSDPTWAIHELVAALDAMDCPVELL